MSAPVLSRWRAYEKPAELWSFAMTPEPTSNALAAPPTETGYFTVEQANRALPYIRRVAEDIRNTFKQAVELQQSMERPDIADNVNALREHYEQIVDKLNGYVDELSETGVALKDFEIGLIDFPALHEGREVLLCWKLGEPRIVAWHETDTGFAGRRDIAEIG